MRETIYAKRIVESVAVIGAEHLFQKKSLQIGLNETETITIEDGGYFILDFGKEMNGGIRILTFLSEHGKARVRFGESLSECCAELGGKQNATNDHALRDFTVELPDYSDMRFGNTGFRFVRLDFSGKVTLKTVVAVNHMMKRKAKYRYEGADERVRQIYETAKRTVDLCAASGYLWDGVKRDRLVWIGDIHPEMLALTTLYGRLPLIEKSLDFVKAQTPLPGWMNNIPTYSLWWAIIVCDYSHRTGAKDFARKQIGYLKRLIEQVNECITEKGEINFPWLFLDWPTNGTADAEKGVRAVCTIAMKKIKELFGEFGEESKTCDETVKKLRRQAIVETKSKAVLGLKYFAEGLTKEEEKILVAGNANGMSAFMSYYVLKAVASFDREKAVEMMKEYYGGMLDKGATTFWEDFDLAWTENSCRIDEFPKAGEKDIHGDFGAYCYKGFRHSFCHGWSAGVLTFIEEEC